MRLIARLATRVDLARRAALRALDRREPDRPGSGRRSLPELARAALKPDEATWLVARAVSLRAF